MHPIKPPKKAKDKEQAPEGQFTDRLGSEEWTEKDLAKLKSPHLDVKAGSR